MYLEKLIKIYKPLARLTKIKREKTQITNIRNETVDITIDSVVIEGKGISHTTLCT